MLRERGGRLVLPCAACLRMRWMRFEMGGGSLPGRVPGWLIPVAVWSPSPAEETRAWDWMYQLVCCPSWCEPSKVMMDSEESAGCGCCRA